MKLFDYLYVGLYRFSLRTSHKDFAEFSAVGLLTFLVVIYLSLFVPARYLPGNTMSGLVVIGIGGLFYLLYCRTGRYKILYEELSEKPVIEQQICSGIPLSMLIGGLIYMFFE